VNFFTSKPSSEELTTTTTTKITTIEKASEKPNEASSSKDGLFGFFTKEKSKSTIAAEKDESTAPDSEKSEGPLRFPLGGKSRRLDYVRKCAFDVFQQNSGFGFILWLLTLL
jgi:hypothetical protein